jgi:hypothetical protein
MGRLLRFGLPAGLMVALDYLAFAAFLLLAGRLRATELTATSIAFTLNLIPIPKPIQGWTLTTLREKRIQIGAKVIAHAKYIIFQLAVVAVPRQLFARILERIARLCPAWASGGGWPPLQTGPKAFAGRTWCVAPAAFGS